MEGFKQGNDFVFYKDPSGLGRTEAGGREADAVAPTARWRRQWAAWSKGGRQEML